MDTESIDVTIRTVNNESFSFSLPTTTSIEELKRLLKESTSISEERQRLIYRGRVLQDSSALVDYSIGTGHVLHMVARPENFNELLQSANRNVRATAAEAAGVAEPSLQTLLGSLFGDTDAGQTQRQQHESSSTAALNTRSGGNVSATHVSEPAAVTVDSRRTADSVNTETVERIRQGFLTMYTLMSTMETVPSLYAQQERDFRTDDNAAQVSAAAANATSKVPRVEATLNTSSSRMSDQSPIASNNDNDQPGARQRISSEENAIKEREFFIGQWLDVKDTVNQWLEATIMQVNQQQRRLFVHYNGWPARWDEWIEFSSSRIAPFRTRTSHYSGLPHSSPTPVTTASHAPLSVLPDTSTKTRSIPTGNDTQMSTSSTEEVTNAATGAVAGDENYDERYPGEIDGGVDETLDGLDSQRPRGEEEQSSVESVSSGLGRSRDRDDVRSLLPTLAKIMRRLQPAVEAAASFAALDATSTDREESQLRSLAEELCPLMDRFGRILTDLSPLLRTVATGNPADSNTSTDIETAEQGGMNYFQMSLASLLRPRPPSPPPMRAYRQPVSVSTRSAPSGAGGILRNAMAAPPAHLDIHIAIMPQPRRETSERSSSNVSTENSSYTVLNHNSERNGSDVNNSAPRAGTAAAAAAAASNSFASAAASALASADDVRRSAAIAIEDAQRVIAVTREITQRRRLAIAQRDALYHRAANSEQYETAASSSSSTQAVHPQETVTVAPPTHALSMSSARRGRRIDLNDIEEANSTTQYELQLQQARSAAASAATAGDAAEVEIAAAADTDTGTGNNSSWDTVLSESENGNNNNNDDCDDDNSDHCSDDDDTSSSDDEKEEDRAAAAQQIERQEEEEEDNDYYVQNRNHSSSTTAAADTEDMRLSVQSRIRNAIDVLVERAESRMHTLEHLQRQLEALERQRFEEELLQEQSSSSAAAAAVAVAAVPDLLITSTAVPSTLAVVENHTTTAVTTESQQENTRESSPSSYSQGWHSPPISNDTEPLIDEGAPYSPLIDADTEASCSPPIDADIEPSCSPPIDEVTETAPCSPPIDADTEASSYISGGDELGTTTEAVRGERVDTTATATASTIKDAVAVAVVAAAVPLHQQEEGESISSNATTNTCDEQRRTDIECSVIPSDYSPDQQRFQTYEVRNRNAVIEYVDERCAEAKPRPHVNECEGRSQSFSDYRENPQQGSSSSSSMVSEDKLESRANTTNTHSGSADTGTGTANGLGAAADAATSSEEERARKSRGGILHKISKAFNWRR